jgi:Prokaryotic N-terminal methylation motif
MNRRTGVTLLEVLIAIFVTAIGLLGLLALFPLGALDMAKAIQFSRSAQCASNGAAIANFQNLRNDANIHPPPPGTVNLYTNPGASPPWSLSIPTWPNITGSTGVGYPVFVDPIGVSLGSNAVGAGTLPTAPGPTPVPGIPRATPSYAAGATALSGLLNFFTLQDEITFQNTGYAAPPNAVAPVFPSTQTVERDDRYTWCYLLQAPGASNLNVVNLTVVVYNGRSSSVLGEHPYYVDLNASTTSVIIPWDPTIGQEKPPIKAGSWILDATVTTPSAAGLVGTPHGYFYRIVNITDATYTNAVNGATYPALLAELQSQIQAGTSGAQQGVIVVMDNVIEVFNRGP